MKIAILIPVFNKIRYTQKCLQALCDSIIRDGLKEYYTLIVIDDGSTDGTHEIIRQHFPDTVILKGDGNLWWSGGINRGAKYAVESRQYDYLLLWNNDILARDDYLKQAVAIASEASPKAIIGSKIFQDIQSGILFSMGGYFNPRNGDFGMIGYREKNTGRYNTVTPADWLPGMGTLVPTGVIGTVGYWDEKNFPQYHGDSEYTYRAGQKGFDIYVDPRLVLYNDVTNTGMSHQKSFKKLIAMLRDKRSLYNLSVNVKFYNRFATHPLAYKRLFSMYFILFGGFIKNRVFDLLRSGK